MPEEKFETNLLRMIVAELYSSFSLQVARAMFGKEYYALGAGERAAVDQAALAQVTANYQAVTPDLLRSSPQANPLGFQGKVNVATASGDSQAKD